MSFWKKSIKSIYKGYKVEEGTTKTVKSYLRIHPKSGRKTFHSGQKTKTIYGNDRWEKAKAFISDEELQDMTWGQWEHVTPKCKKRKR